MAGNFSSEGSNVATARVTIKMSEIKKMAESADETAAEGITLLPPVPFGPVLKGHTQQSLKELFLLVTDTKRVKNAASIVVNKTQLTYATDKMRPTGALHTNLMSFVHYKPDGVWLTFVTQALAGFKHVPVASVRMLKDALGMKNNGKGEQKWVRGSGTIEALVRRMAEGFSRTPLSYMKSVDELKVERVRLFAPDSKTDPYPDYRSERPEDVDVVMNGKADTGLPFAQGVKKGEPEAMNDALHLARKIIDAANAGSEAFTKFARENKDLFTFRLKNKDELGLVAEYYLKRRPYYVAPYPLHIVLHMLCKPMEDHMTPFWKDPRSTSAYKLAWSGGGGDKLMAWIRKPLGSRKFDYLQFGDDLWVKFFTQKDDDRTLWLIGPDVRTMDMSVSDKFGPLLKDWILRQWPADKMQWAKPLVDVYLWVAFKTLFILGRALTYQKEAGLSSGVTFVTISEMIVMSATLEHAHDALPSRPFEQPREFVEFLTDHLFKNFGLQLKEKPPTQRVAMGDEKTWQFDEPKELNVPFLGQQLRKVVVDGRVHYVPMPNLERYHAGMLNPGFAHGSSTVTRSATRMSAAVSYYVSGGYNDILFRRAAKRLYSTHVREGIKLEDYEFPLGFENAKPLQLDGKTGLETLRTPQRLPSPRQCELFFINEKVDLWQEESVQDVDEEAEESVERQSVDTKEVKADDIFAGTPFAPERPATAAMAAPVDAKDQKPIQTVLRAPLRVDKTPTETPVVHTLDLKRSGGSEIRDAEKKVNLLQLLSTTADQALKDYQQVQKDEAKQLDRERFDLLQQANSAEASSRSLFAARSTAARVLYDHPDGKAAHRRAAPVLDDVKQRYEYSEQQRRALEDEAQTRLLDSTAIDQQLAGRQSGGISDTVKRLQSERDKMRALHAAELKKLQQDVEAQKFASGLQEMQRERKIPPPLVPSAPVRQSALPVLKGSTLSAFPDFRVPERAQPNAAATTTGSATVTPPKPFNWADDDSLLYDDATAELRILDVAPTVKRSELGRVLSKLTDQEKAERDAKRAAKTFAAQTRSATASKERLTKRERVELEGKLWEESGGNPEDFVPSDNFSPEALMAQDVEFVEDELNAEDVRADEYAEALGQSSARTRLNVPPAKRPHPPRTGASHRGRRGVR